MADIAVVYAEDTLQWVHYIHKHISTDLYSRFEHYNIIEVITLNSDSRRAVQSANAVIIIVSPALSQSLCDTGPECDFTGLTSETEHRMIIYCGLEYDMLRDDGIIDRFPNIDSWVHVSVNSDPAEKMIDIATDMLTRAKQSVESKAKISAEKSVKKKAKELAEFIVTRDKVSPQGKSTSESRQSKGERRGRKSWPTVKVYPSKVQCMEDIDVLLVLTAEVEHAPDHILLYLEGESTLDRLSTNAQKINPYSYEFKAAAHAPGIMKVVLMVDGYSVGCTQFEYVGNGGEVEHITQLHLGVLDTLFQECFVNKKMKRENIDQAIRSYMDGWTKAQDIFRCYETEAIEDTSERELPTWLHLTAKYGLPETTAWLTNQAGSQVACSITNFTGHYPYDIAQVNGFTEISSFLKDFLELEMDEELLYEDMVKFTEKLTEPGPGDIYMDMGGSKYSVDSYEDPEKLGYKRPFPVPLECTPDEGGYSSMMIHRNTISDMAQTPSGYISMGRRYTESSIQRPAAPFPVGTSDIYDPVELKESAPDIPERNRSRSADTAVKSAPTEDKPLPVMNSQEELIEIMQKVKEGVFSVEDARYMFIDWQFKHKRNSQGSFKEKQKQMAVLREEFKKCQEKMGQDSKQKTVDEKAKRSTLAKFFGRRSPSKGKSSSEPPPVQTKPKVLGKKKSDSSITSIQEAEEPPIINPHQQNSDDDKRDSGFPADMDGDQDTEEQHPKIIHPPARSRSFVNPHAVHARRVPERSPTRLDNTAIPDDIPDSIAPSPPPRCQVAPPPPIPPREARK